MALNLAPLPEELLLRVIEDLAYLPDPYDLSKWPPELRFNSVSQELLFLSSASKQIRRICLPFLFAYVPFRDPESLSRHRDYFNTSVLDLIRRVQNTSSILVIRFDLREDLDPLRNSSILRETLPRLKNLSCIDLRFANALGVPFLNAVRNYTVLVRSFSVLPADDLASLDLSKISIFAGDVSFFTDHLPSSSPRSPFKSISCLDVGKADLVGDSFGNQVYRGLHSLIYCNEIPLMKWLPAFTANHPFLFEIRSHYDPIDDPDDHRVPCFDGFVENARQAQVDYCKFDIPQYTLTRTSPSSGFPKPIQIAFQGWYLSDLHIRIWESTIQILTLVAGSFPNLGSLDLHFGHTSLGGLDLEYDPDEVNNILASFHSLTDLRSTNMFSHLRLPSSLISTMEPDIDPSPPNETSGTVWKGVQWKVRRYAPRIALAVPSLKSMFISEDVAEIVGTSPTAQWKIDRSDGKLNRLIDLNDLNFDFLP
ncbi:hypothetical protein D9757_005237 [Collybiopsis confluens]|uniref:Uncharacterized protein n=1 Tax=Collybiopsis confluens TaxID=2823264 RepID=A0A8H5HVW8_9AGAR|nr:hypothetical protein D9757_005237 [Collybiopsis confluens]